MLKTISSYIVFILLAICFGASQGLASTRIAVLVSSGSQPYMDTLAGLQETLNGILATAECDVFHLDNEEIKAQITIEKIKVQKPDVLITLGALAFNSVTDQIDDIPIVAGLLLTKEKIQRHKNATGVVLEIPLSTQFIWLKKIFPAAHDVGVLYNPEQNENVIREAEKQAQLMGIELISQPVSSPRILPTALKNLVGKVEVLWGLSDTIVLNKKTARNILLFSFRNKIPFVGLSMAWVKSGAYYALDRNYRDIGAQCGEITGAIVNGTAVDTIAPVSPRQIIYSVNTRTAKRMFLNIDQLLINGASKVY